MNGPLYEGKPLTIGIIGEAPEVRETNVSFVPLGLEEMAKNPEKLPSRFDAVFIMKDYFREAYAPQYKKAYQEAGLPFIFIQIDKLLPMYMEEDVSYDDAPSANDLRFAAGYYRTPKDEEKQWGFGLYNDTENETNVKTTYSTIFRTIESKSLD